MKVKTGIFEAITRASDIATPFVKRTMSFAIATTNMNHEETYIGTLLASWHNEWGALRGSNPYATFADSLVRAVIPATGAPYTGNTGNALEIQDRRPSTVLYVWGRRWIDGRLMRNTYLVREVYLWKTGDADPTAGGTIALPAGVTWMFQLATADTLPSWAPSGSIVVRS